jgi:hypothetical protein
MTKGALIGTAVATTATTNAQKRLRILIALIELPSSKQDEWRDCHSNCHRHESGNAKQITNADLGYLHGISPLICTSHPNSHRYRENVGLRRFGIACIVMRRCTLEMAAQATRIIEW